MDTEFICPIDVAFHVDGFMISVAKEVSPQYFSLFLTTLVVRHKCFLTCTGITDLYMVNSSIVGVTAKWLELGLSLGLSPSILKVIEIEQPKDTSRCMTETLAAWLQKKGKDPNWRSLVTALESLSIDRDIILKITREHSTLCGMCVCVCVRVQCISMYACTLNRSA